MKRELYVNCPEVELPQAATRAGSLELSRQFQLIARIDGAGHERQGLLKRGVHCTLTADRNRQGVAAAIQPYAPLGGDRTSKRNNLTCQRIAFWLHEVQSIAAQGQQALR